MRLSLPVLSAGKIIAWLEVNAEAVLGLKIVIGEAQRDAAVVVGASADNARAEPAEFVSGRDGVGLTRDFPISVGRTEKTERLRAAEIHLGMRAGATVVHLIG